MATAGIVFLVWMEGDWALLFVFRVYYDDHCGVISASEKFCYYYYYSLEMMIFNPNPPPQFGSRSSATVR